MASRILSADEGFARERGSRRGIAFSFAKFMTGSKIMAVVMMQVVELRCKVGLAHGFNALETQKQNHLQERLQRGLFTQTTRCACMSTWYDLYHKDLLTLYEYIALYP